jgi:molecular chaperone GrpE
MSAPPSGKGNLRAVVGKESDTEGPQSEEDIEILEVIGVNETEPVMGPYAGSEGAGGEHHPLRYGDHPAEEAGAARDETKKRLDEALAEKDKFHDLWLRAQAETENLRKRAERDMEERRLSDASSLFRRLLPILDSLERALASPATPDDPLVRGITLTLQQMLEVLKKEGLEPIAARGRHFDPRLHEAVEMVAVEGTEDGVVLEEMQRGYLYRDRLVRPALVRVSGAGPSAVSADRRAAG